MLVVFIAGACGFLIFDFYRIYANSLSGKGVTITFSVFKGLGAHLFVYCAAGLLGLFTNIDVLLAQSASESNEMSDFSGAILRSFSLGVLGPAAIKKPNDSNERQATLPTGPAIDDTPVTEASFWDYVRYFLMR